jgi:hypothetical protein
MNARTFLFLLLILLFLTACTSSPVSLHQDAGNVVRIDLLYSPFGEQALLHSLEGDALPDFLTALGELSLRKNGSPQDIGGSLIIHIIYADGSIDLLGDSSVGYCTGGIWEHDGWYCVDSDDMYAFFSEYTDLSDLPYTENHAPSLMETL